MFQAGDEVTSGLDQETVSILKEFGVSNPESLSQAELEAEIIKIEQELNNPSLVGKGGTLFDYTDPLDYVSAGLTLTGIGAGIGTAIKGTKIAAKLKKLNDLRKKLSIIKRKKPGIAVPGQKGFQARNPYSPFSYEYNVPAIAGYSTLGGVGVGMMGGDEYAGLPDELQNKLNELQAEKGFEVVGDDKAKAKKPQSEIAERDKKIGEFIKLYQEAREKEAEDYKRRQRNFDRSNLYMEEVASALAESGGDIGYGLSKGAAEAAKRISADEMAKEKLIQELRDKEAEANKLKETTVLDILERYSTKTDELAGTKYLRGELATLVSIVDPNAGDTGWTTGIRGWIARFGDELKGLIGTDQSLSKASTAKNIAKYLEANLVQQLLQESGRTISDRDRVLIKEILGDLTKIVSNRADILNALRKVDAALQRSAREQANNILALRNRYGSRIPELQIYDREIDMESIVPVPGAQTSADEDDVVITEEDVIVPGAG